LETSKYIGVYKVEILSKEQIIDKLRGIKASGWIPNARQGNAGGVGNTLEDLLGIEENNLPIPNAAEWELKTQRATSNSLTTLFHMEPSPRAFRFVPRIFLLQYGWKHQEAGIRYPDNEKSFHQTISGKGRSSRGFTVIVDRNVKKILVSFDAQYVQPQHAEWLESVKQRVGLGELNPQPYWGFDDLFHKAGTKLLNCFYVQAQVKRERGQEYFFYETILKLEKFSIEKFLFALDENIVLVDFDARTGHNHGSKFRIRQKMLPTLYADIAEL
jgi:hypothetical protein